MNANKFPLDLVFILPCLAILSWWRLDVAMNTALLVMCMAMIIDVGGVYFEVFERYVPVRSHTGQEFVLPAFLVAWAAWTGVSILILMALGVLFSRMFRCYFEGRKTFVRLGSKAVFKASLMKSDFVGQHGK